MKTGIGIEVTASGIHYVEMDRTSEGVKLLTAATFQTDLFSSKLAAQKEPEIIESTASLLDKYISSGTIGRKGIIGFSGTGLIMRYTRVMQAQVKRQKLLIDFEIKEMTAQGGEGLISAHTKLPIETPGNEDTVMVSLVKDDFLEGINLKLKKIGLSASYFTPSCIALYNSYLLSGEEISNDIVMVAAIDRETTEIILIENGSLLFARNINTGGQLFIDALNQKKELPEDKAWGFLLSKGDITPPASAKPGTPMQVTLWGAGEEIFRLLESSINFARLQLRKPRLDVRKIYIAGELARLKGINLFFNSRFNRPVERLNPFNSVDKTKLTSSIGAKQATLVAKNPYPFAVAAGLAKIDFEDDPLTLELRPASFHRKSIFINRTLFVYLSLIVIIIVLALKAVAYNTDAAKVEKIQKDTQSVLSKMKNEAKTLESTVKEHYEREPIAITLKSSLYPSLYFYELINAVRKYGNEHPEITIESVVLEPFASADESSLTGNYKLILKLYFENLGKKTQGHLSSFEYYLRENVGDAIVAFSPTPLDLPAKSALMQAEYYEFVIEIDKN